MSTSRHSPPPIGEALSQGFAIYKANFGPVLIGSLCAMVCGFVPIIGQLLVIPGMYNVALKAVRKQKIAPEDGFIAFKALGDYLVIGLLMSLGVLLCIVGVFITRPLFAPGMFYVLDKKLSWSKAKDKCMSDVKPHLLSWFLFDLVIAFVPSMIGLLLCGVGLFFTAPITSCAMAYAYEKSLKDSDSITADASAPLSSR